MRYWIATIATAAILITATSGSTQDFPNRPIKLVVDSAPGGGGDILTRVVAQALEQQVGGSVVVENKAGGGGNLAAGAVATSPADGYTLLMATSNWTSINPSLYASMPYYPTDFEPIVRVASFPIVLSAHPAAGIADLNALIDRAKSSPGGINYASTGMGSIQHLTMELVQQMAGVQFEHIPYKAGAPALADLLAGRVQIGLVGLPPTAPRVKAGELVGLAVFDAERSPLIPDVPTYEEVLGEKVYAVAWTGLYAAQGTPQEILVKINEAVNAALETDALKQRLTDLGYSGGGGSVEDLTAYMAEDAARWKVAVDLSGLKF